MVKITIEITNAEELFKQNAPWYGKVAAFFHLVKKEEKVAEEIASKIKTQLQSTGVDADVEWEVE